MSPPRPTQLSPAPSDQTTRRHRLRAGQKVLHRCPVQRPPLPVGAQLVIPQHPVHMTMGVTIPVGVLQKRRTHPPTSRNPPTRVLVPPTVMAHPTPRRVMP